MEIHDAANLFPLIEGEDFERLKADIAAHGQRETIKLLDGKVLDGRNRLRVCHSLGRAPLTESLPPDTDPLEYVLSLNLHRRHLDESQRGMVAARLANMLRGSNRFEKKHPGVDGPIGPSTLNGTVEAVSVQQAAERLNVGTRTVKRARRIQEKAIPEIQQMVEQGELTLNAADKIVSLPERDQRKAAAGGAKAVRDRVTPKRNGAAGKRPSGKKKRSTAGKHFVTEDEAFSALADTQRLVAEWEKMGGFKKLVLEWEDAKRWTFCDELESLAKILRKLSNDLRHHGRL